DVSVQIEDLRRDRRDRILQVVLALCMRRGGRQRQQRYGGSVQRYLARQVTRLRIRFRAQAHSCPLAPHALLNTRWSSAHAAPRFCSYAFASTRLSSRATALRSAGDSSSPNATLFPANRNVSRGARLNPWSSTATRVQ